MGRGVRRGVPYGVHCIASGAVCLAMACRVSCVVSRRVLPCCVVSTPARCAVSCLARCVVRCCVWRRASMSHHVAPCRTAPALAVLYAVRASRRRCRRLACLVWGVRCLCVFWCVYGASTVRLWAVLSGRAGVRFRLRRSALSGLSLWRAIVCVRVRWSGCCNGSNDAFFGRSNGRIWGVKKYFWIFFCGAFPQVRGCAGVLRARRNRGFLGWPKWCGLVGSGCIGVVSPAGRTGTG